MKKLILLFMIPCLFLSCNKLIDFLPGRHDPHPELKKVYGGSGQDEIISMIGTEDGGYFLAANNGSTDGDVTENKGDKDAWAVKLDKEGKIDWQRSLGGSNFDLIYSAVTHHNAYVAAGLTTSNDGDVVGHHGDYDGWIVKLSGDGDLVWQKPYGGTGSENFEQLIHCGDGGYLAVGLTNSNDGDVSGHHGEDDAWIVKIDESGSIEWQKALGGTGTDRALGVTSSADGGFLVVGQTNSTDGDADATHGSTDAWVIKLDNHGNIQWQKTFGGTEIEFFTHVVQSWDGDFVMTGATNSNDGDVSGNHGENDVWVVRISNDGELVWQKTFGGTNFEEAREIVPTLDAGYVITGPTFSDDGDVKGNHGGIDGWVLKIDRKGRKQWQQTVGGTNDDVLNTVVGRWDGQITVGGWTTSNDGDISGNHGSNDAWLMSIKK